MEFWVRFKLIDGMFFFKLFESDSEFKEFLADDKEGKFKDYKMNAGPF